MYSFVHDFPCILINFTLILCITKKYLVRTAFFYNVIYEYCDEKDYRFLRTNRKYMQL
jgi:hypothetical protein